MRDNYRNDFRSDRRQYGSQKPPRTPLDMKFLSSGYYQDTEKKKLREDLIKTEAEKLGQKLATLDPKLTSSQLRKFFNEVRSLEAQVEENFDAKKALIFMLKSKVAYAAGKKSGRIPVEFKEFIDACIDKINDKNDFQGFVKFFESVVGYYFFYNPKKEE